MRKGENPSEVLGAVKTRIELLNHSILPKGVQIVPYYDRTWLIHTTLKTVFKNLLEGALLVSAVLFVFLGNARAAGIVAIMIPLSLLATFIGLKWRGIPANLLSLGAMDFGIIVDGAVIVVENIFRNLYDHGHSTNRDKLRELRMADTNFGWTVEMQIKAARAKLRITQVAVDYRPRIGHSKITGTLSGTIRAGYKILYTIFRYGIGQKGNRR